jgi:hypothetical protein
MAVAPLGIGDGEVVARHVGNPPKLTALSKRFRHVLKVRSQPAKALKLSPTTTAVPMGRLITIRCDPDSVCAAISAESPVLLPLVQTSLPRASALEAIPPRPVATNSKASMTCETVPAPRRPAVLMSTPQRASPRSQAQLRWKIRPAGWSSLAARPRSSAVKASLPRVTCPIWPVRMVARWLGSAQLTRNTVTSASS